MAKLTAIKTLVAHKRLPPQQRRDQIIEEAKHLFAEQGVGSVTMRSLGKRCGITQASLYQHFADKDAILFTICRGYFTRMLEEFHKASAPIADPLERMLAVMRAYIELGLANPEEYRLTFMTPVSGIVQTPLVAAPPCAGPELPGNLAFGFLQDMVSELMELGKLRPGNPQAVAEAIWASGHGLVALLITHRHYVWSDIEAMKQVHLDIMLHGMLALDATDGQNSANKIIE